MDHRAIVRFAAVLAVAAVSALDASAGAAPARAAAAKPAPAHAYVVRAGDGGWFQIAHAHGVTMQQLLAANHATATTRVMAGQKINVPATVKAKARAAAPPKHA
jgi:LysM repeat protein